MFDAIALADLRSRVQIVAPGLIGPVSAIVTIVDDDPTPTLAMADISIIEGNTGSTPGNRGFNPFENNGCTMWGRKPTTCHA